MVGRGLEEDDHANHYPARPLVAQVGPDVLRAEIVSPPGWREGHRPSKLTHRVSKLEEHRGHPVNGRWLGLGTIGTVAAVFAASAAMLAPPAQAEVFCAPSPCAPGTEVATIEDAVDAADAQAGPDTVAIEPGTHFLPNGPCGGLFVTDIETSVIGAGIGATVLTVPPLPPDFGSTRSVICGHMQLADVTLRLASAQTPGKNSSMAGIDLYSGSIDRVRIDAEGASFGPDINDGQGEAGLIRGGSVRDLEADLDPALDTDGLRLSGGITEVSDTTIRSGGTALSGRITRDASGDPPTALSRLRLHARSPFSLINNSGKDGAFTLSDSVLDASGADPGSEPIGLRFGNSFQPNSLAGTVDRVTIVGNGDPDSVAISVYGRGVPPTVLNASHLAVSGFDVTLNSGLQGGDVEATIDNSVLDLSPSAITTDGGGPGSATNNFGPGNVSADPQLVNPAAGDFRLLHSSPAVDIGGPDLIPGGATDLNGAPRPADGDGDGIIATDAGAFEHVNNAVRIRKIKRRRNGKAVLTIAVPNPGDLKLKGRKVKARGKTLVDNGKTRMKVVPRRKAKRQLRKRGKARVRVKLKFRPDGGTLGTKSARIKLRRKR
jgi:hypothetical protein